MCQMTCNAMTITGVRGKIPYTCIGIRNKIYCCAYKRQPIFAIEVKVLLKILYNIVFNK